jgi:cell division protein FtsW (lipid II flippase)
VSYGGSSLIFSFAMIGLLLSILRRSSVGNVTEMPILKQKVLEVRL